MELSDRNIIHSNEKSLIYASDDGGGLLKSSASCLYLYMNFLPNSSVL